MCSMSKFSISDAASVSYKHNQVYVNKCGTYRWKIWGMWQDKSKVCLFITVYTVRGLYSYPQGSNSVFLKTYITFTLGCLTVNKTWIRFVAIGLFYWQKLKETLSIHLFAHSGIVWIRNNPGKSSIFRTNLKTLIRDSAEQFFVVWTYYFQAPLAILISGVSCFSLTFLNLLSSWKPGQVRFLHSEGNQYQTKGDH